MLRRILTLNFHPFIKFVKINAAYSVLGNKKERRMYDLEVLMRSDPRYKPFKNLH